MPERRPSLFPGFGCIVCNENAIQLPIVLFTRVVYVLEFRSPYLIIVQFNSIEIILLDVEGLSSADNCKMDRAYLSFPKSVLLRLKFIYVSAD